MALALQFSRYIIAGLLGSAVYAAVFALINEIAFSAAAASASAKAGAYLIANALAFAASSIVVFMQNRVWVFRNRNPLIGRQLALFYLVAFASWAASAPLGAWLVAARFWNEYLALAVTIGVSVVANFVGRRHFVFRS